MGSLCIVLVVDLFWAVVEGSTGTLAYGLFDEPAHLATCAVALGGLALAIRAPLGRRFVVAALIGSVAIDLDHIPGYLGSDVLTGPLPRPYTHSVAIILLLLAAAIVLRGLSARQILLGLAFGISTHLIRDISTGPGISLLWPLDDTAIRMPYAFYATALAIAVVARLSRRARGRRAADVAAPPALLPMFAGAVIAAVVLNLAWATTAKAQVAVGAYIPGADNAPNEIDDYARDIGKNPAVILIYKDWGQPVFEPEQLDGIWSHGAQPMVTWEPWRDERGVGLRAIAHGRYDRYIHKAAQAAVAWSHPLMVRFGQEMNAPWFPWSGHPSAYRAAFRHVVRLFRAAGAAKVRWVWTPYIESNASRPFRPYYPGGKWVDWTGLDGINWGGSYPWRSFQQMFGGSYRRLLALSPHKPIVIAETGSGEAGGSKAHWISQMLRRTVPRMTHIRAIVFWSVDDRRGDIRVDSSPSAAGSLRRALRNPLYTSSRSLVDRGGG